MLLGFLSIAYALMNSISYDMDNNCPEANPNAPSKKKTEKQLANDFQS